MRKAFNREGREEEPLRTRRQKVEVVTSSSSDRKSKSPPCPCKKPQGRGRGTGFDSKLFLQRAHVGEEFAVGFGFAEFVDQ
jgi:hypothetical protein